jgi:hypothetical protein
VPFKNKFLKAVINFVMSVTAIFDEIHCNRPALKFVRLFLFWFSLVLLRT